MSAPGRPLHYNGDAPLTTVAAAKIDLPHTCQRITVHNAEPLLGGALLRVSIDTEGVWAATMQPGDYWWEENLRITRIYVQSGTVGSTAAYEITVVEQ